MIQVEDWEHVIKTEQIKERMAENCRETINICQTETLKSYQWKTILQSQHSRLYVDVGFQLIINSEKKIVNKIAGKSYHWVTCVHDMCPR